MKVRSTCAVGLAALALTLVGATAEITSANPRARIDVGRAAAKISTPGALQRRRNAPAPCATDYSPSFEAISSATEVAGNTSGIAGGFQNYACDVDDGVLSGESNEIGMSSDTNQADWSSIGGGETNTITSSASFIGAGNMNTVSSQDSFDGAGEQNSTAASFSFLGSGVLAKISLSGEGSFIGAGSATFSQNCECDSTGNSIEGADSFIGTGDLNDVSGNGSFIGAGDYQYSSVQFITAPGNQISGNDSFLGAGDQNTIAANESFIGSGGFNAIKSGGAYSSIIGGNRNTVSGEYASIIGGYGSTASGSYAIVAGGNGDTAAGTLSFAAGYHADAAHNGSFVWSDYSSGSTPVKDSAINQFVARASGGFTLYSNEAATAGVQLTAGSGTWASLSDRNAKTNVVPVDDATILAKVSTLPITAWQYTSERGVRHVGPMAQDFYAAFGTGVDDRHITSIDEDGVALAAVKAVNAKLDRKTHEVTQLHAEVATLHGDVLRLEAEVNRLARR